MGLFIFLLFFSGLHLARYSAAVPIEAGWLIVMGLWFWVFFRHSRSRWGFELYVLGFAAFWLLGLFSFDKTHQPSVRLEDKIPLTVCGVIMNQPVVKDQQVFFSFRVNSVFSGEKEYKADAKMYVFVNRYAAAELMMKDTLKFSGKFRANTEDKAFDQYLKLNGFSGKITVSSGKIERLKKGEEEWVQALKIRILKTLMQPLESGAFSENTLGLFKALLFGEKAGLPLELKDTLIHTNVLHIIAVSGYHFTVIGGIFCAFLGFFGIGKPLRFYLVIPILWVFLMLIDFPASAYRAWIMIALYWGAYLVGRLQNPLHITGVSGIFLLIVNPLYCVDPGFILSYAAVISLLGPGRFLDHFLKQKIFPLKKKWMREEPPYHYWEWTEKIGSVLIFSTVAWVGTAPLVIYYFKIFSTVSLLANLLAIILLPFVFICLLSSVFIGQFFLMAGEAYGYVAQGIFNILVKGFIGLESIPGSYFEIEEFSVSETLAGYALLILVFAMLYRKIKPDTLMHFSSTVKKS